MTLYAGEEFRITTTAFDFDGSTALTDADVNGMTVTVYDSASAVVVDAEAMTYDDGLALWVFVWDTTGVASGTYRAKVVVTGVDNGLSWEWKRIRLAKDLVVS